MLVSLGSSFASGPGVSPFANKAAMRSSINYPHLVARALDMDVVDLTIAGATTATVLIDAQRLGRHTFAPQIRSFPSSADVVTLTIGGNDLGYVGEIMVRAVGHRTDRLFLGLPVTAGLRRARPLKDVTRERSDAVEAGMVGVIEAVQERAPQARIVLVDYLPVFPEGTVQPLFSDDEIAHFRRMATALSAVYANAAERTGVELVPASAYEEGHGPDATEPWLFSLRTVRDIASSFHPTEVGMQAVADQVLLQLAR